VIVAAGQAAAVSGDLAANVRTAARLTALAATQEVRLLVLPEAFLTGYDVAAFDGPLPDADDLDGSWLDPLREQAAAGVTVVASTALRRGASRSATTAASPSTPRPPPATERSAT
jgi:predicted amidohydrolase